VIGDARSDMARAAKGNPMASTNNDDDVSAMLRESASGWLAGRHSVARMRGELGVPQHVDRACWREMGEMGWLGIVLPESVGGAGLGLTEASALAEVFGGVLLPEPFVAGAVMAGTVLAAAVRDAGAGLAAELGAELASGERVFALAWQSAARALDQAPGVVTLNGTAVTGVVRFVPAVEADGVLLVCATDAHYRPVVVAVDAGSPGVAIERAAGGNGNSVATVEFMGAPIRAGAPLLTGDAAIRGVSLGLDRGRVTTAAHLTGLASAALAGVLEYVGQRKQFDRTIGSFQVTRHRCVDMHIGTMLAGAAFRHAARCEQREPQRFAVEAAAAKARAGDVAMHVCRTATQLYGGIGFTHEADIGLYLRAAIHLSSWLGTATHLRRRFLVDARKQEMSHV
jgi:alkylation response protein AidB-like acyl-CoA dehydrogenase